MAIASHGAIGPAEWDALTPARGKELLRRLEEYRATERDQLYDFAVKAVDGVMEGQNAMIRSQGNTQKAIGDLGRMIGNMIRAMR